ncbi:MAG: glycosyltransferase family 1 protein [Calditrichaeota bacterium]|nr:MAG: glycosyltransferase family 1 protein [Calditrichota bacterium]
MAGSTLSIYYLARGLAQNGHRVIIGCSADVLLYQLLDQTSIIPAPMTFKNKFDLQNMRQIRDIVKRYHIDLVNAQSGIDRYTSIFARWIFKLDVALVHTRRQKPMSLGFFLQNWLYYRGTDKIIAVSHGVKQGLIQMGIPPHHILVIYNGTPREKYESVKAPNLLELRRRYGINPAIPIIGCVSRLKQQDQLLAALNYVDTKTAVIFIGIEEQPQFRDFTIKYADRHQIIYAGQLTQAETLEHYPLFDLKVLPSNMEGLSQALLEAMAMGIPVIATKASGNFDLIRDNQNGLYFEEHNVIQLAQKITLLLENPDLRHRLAECGKRTALEEFSIERTISHYEKEFAEIIKERNEKKR